MSEHYINLNGNLLKEKQCGLSVQNRAFKFGDSFFETIRISKGRALFTEDHFSRLTKGMKEMNFEIPSHWNQSFFRKEILKTLEKNEITGGGRSRFTVFRKADGFYTPKGNEFAFTVEAIGGENNAFVLNENGQKLGIYTEIPIFPTRLTPFKSNNALVYISAGIWAQKSGFDEVMILNHEGNITEGISSNVFLHVDGMLYTPSLKEGCTAGVMRKKILQLAKKLGMAVIETSISPAVLSEADEVFTTNAIRGINWIGSFEKKRYFHKVSGKLLEELNASNSRSA